MCVSDQRVDLASEHLISDTGMLIPSGNDGLGVGILHPLRTQALASVLSPLGPRSLLLLEGGSCPYCVAT